MADALITAYHIGRKLRIEATDLDKFMKNTKGTNQPTDLPTDHFYIDYHRIL